MAVLNASFVRIIGERDRIYVTRSNGTEVSWVFPTYGDVPPHDMIHLIVESAFHVRQGFWGRVDGGADPGVISEQANRMGGPNKFAAFGKDLTELALAEVLANAGWLMKDAGAEALRDHLASACRDAGLPAPPSLSSELTARVREVLLKLAWRWKAIHPKGSIQLPFDSRDPGAGFEAISAAWNLET